MLEQEQAKRRSNLSSHQIWLEKKDVGGAQKAPLNLRQALHDVYVAQFNAIQKFEGEFGGR